MDLLQSIGLGGEPRDDGRMFYAIYQDSGPVTDADLRALAASCMALVLSHLQGYIWQHERFNLQSSLQEPPPWMLQRRKGQSAAASEPPCVWGSQRYGDNVEDEWFVVWLLLEVTRQLPDISVRVWDTDGEFMLFEAAVNELPRWLDAPEKSSNRVWLRGGHLHAVPPPSSRAPMLPAFPTLHEALQILHSGTVETYFPRVEAPVLERVAGYPAAARQNMHTVHCTLPLRAAHVLRHEPQLISAAVDAFYNRDPDDVKLASAMRHFPTSEGMVTSAVVMPRLMCAQLRQQQHIAPRGYPMPLPSDAGFKAADLGMKVAAGLEIVCARGEQEGAHQPDTAPAHDQSSSSMGSSAAVSQQQLAHNPAWAAYLKSLQRNDYFQGNIPGSQAYKQRMAAAVSAFAASDAYARSSAALAAPAARVAAVLAEAPLPDGGVDAWQAAAGPLPPETSDAWMQQQLDAEFERQMARREAEQARHGAERQQRAGAFGAAAGSSSRGVGADEGVDAAGFARAMHGFVEHGAGLEGAEVPGSSGGYQRGTMAVSMDDRRLYETLLSMVGDMPEGEAGGELARLKAMLGALGVHGDDDESDDETSEGSSFYSGSSSGSESDVEDEEPDVRKPANAPGASSSGAALVQQGGWEGAPSYAANASQAAEGDGRQAEAAAGAPVAAMQTDMQEKPQNGNGHPPAGQEDADNGGGSEAGSMHISDLSIDESDDDLPMASGYDSDDDSAPPTTAGNRAFHEAYSRAMERELAATKLGQMYEGAAAPAGEAPAAGAADAGPNGSGSNGGDAGAAVGPGGLLPVDVDLNLVASMMRSFESQEGLPGPASNLAGLLGFSLATPPGSAAGGASHAGNKC